MAKEVANPRRVLAVSIQSQTDHLSRVVQDLTGKTPEPPDSGSLAGTTHDLSLKTQYYSATVPIWLDLISSPDEWADSFLSEEAQQVLAVLGGLVLVFAIPPSESDSTKTETTDADLRSLISQVGKVVKEGLGGWEWDGVGLAVGISAGHGDDVDEWDDLCAQAGLEFVHLSSDQPDRNEFGEKTGISRVKEALEANDWAQLDAVESLSDFGDFEDPDERLEKNEDSELDPESLDFGFDRADFVGLRKAIWTSGQECPNNDDSGNTQPTDKSSKDTASTSQPTKAKELSDASGRSKAEQEADVAAEELDDEEIARMEKMMRKLQAVREAGEGMGQEQRRRMAARAVQEVMKEL